MQERTYLLYTNLKESDGVKCQKNIIAQLMQPYQKSEVNIKP